MPKKSTTKKVKAKDCRAGFLYRYDDDDIIGMYTPVTPCDIVTEGILESHPKRKDYVHFTVFLRENQVQGAIVAPNQNMIEIGELSVSVK